MKCSCRWGSCRCCCRWAPGATAGVPFAIVIVLYAVWRAHMLGELLGGYTPGGALALDPSAVARAFAGLPSLLFHPGPIGTAVAAVATATIVAWALRAGAASGAG